MARQKTIRTPKKSFRKIPRLWLEALEDRTLPSGTSLPAWLQDGMVGPKLSTLKTVNQNYNNLVQNHPTAEVTVLPPLLPGMVPPQIASGNGNPLSASNVDTRTPLASNQAQPGGSHRYPPPLGVTIVGNVIVNNQALDGIGSNFTQSETANIVYGNTVVVGFNDSESYNNNFVPSAQFTGYAISTNDGQTFTDLGSLPSNPNGDLGDPVLARDTTSGTIYFSTLAFGSFFGTPVIQVFRSNDGGNTFQAPVNAAPGITAGDFPDKDWLAVDNFAGAGQGNVYSTFTDFGSTVRITLTRSTDGGTTWGPSGGVTIATGVVQGSYVVVGPDHSVYVFWLDGNGPSQRLMVRRSTDQGNTFGPAQVVATLNTFGVNGDLFLGGFRSNAFPHVAINPVNGDLYVAYNDTPLNGDRSNIYFTQSSDGGNTWSAPVLVNDDGGSNDQWQPAIAVKPNGSELFIGWYDRRLDPFNYMIDTFGAVADINTGTHAVTFQPNFRISTTSFPPVFGVDPAVNSSYMGDYDTASADNTNFYFTWGDNRDATAPDVRFARIQTGLTVVATTPAAGSFVSTAPTDFVIHFSDAYNPATVQASALTVNSIAANSVTQTDATTLTFHYLVSPASHEGPQAMAMAANALQRLSDGTPLQAFTATFYFDTLRLHVNSTSPAPGGILNLPGNLSVQFNEAVDPTSVSTSNLVLSVGTVAAATLSADHTSVAYAITGLADGTTFTVTLAAGSMRDADGNPGPDTTFSASYSANILVSPYPTPLAPKTPLGSLIYDPLVSASTGFVGDTDSFTISLDAGQTAAVLVKPDANLQPSVRLIAPDGTTVVGSATGSGPGMVAAIQATAVATAGTYTLVVSGANNTTGAFTAQLFLNAAFQNETTVGPPNSDDTTAGAQNLTNAFINLASGTSRAAVVGKTEGGAFVGPDPFGYQAVAVTPTFTDISSTGTAILQGTDDSGYYVPFSALNGFHFSMYGQTYSASSDSLHDHMYINTDGWLTFQYNESFFFYGGDLSSYPTSAAIAPFWNDLIFIGPSGAVYYQVINPSGTDPQLVIEWKNAQGFYYPGVGFTFEAVLDSATGNIQFNYQNLAYGTPYDNGAAAGVGIKDFGFATANHLTVSYRSGPNAFIGSNQSTLIGLNVAQPGSDYYSVPLNAGQSATFALKDQTSNPAHLDLEDASGHLLALGNPVNTNVTEVINNFIAPASGTYYVHVTGLGAKYNLVVTRAADFMVQPNFDAAHAQALDGTSNVLGNLAQVGTFFGAQQVVGYYTDFNTADTNPAAAITQDGFIPVQITNLSTFNLSTINILMLDESNNNGPSSDVLNSLPAIQTFVQNGGVFVVHDRFVSPSEGLAQHNPFVIGAPNTLSERNFTFGGDIDVITTGTLVTNGPNGTIDNNSLDGGDFSDHGWTIGTTLPNGAVPILSAGPDTNNVASFSYSLGSGAVYYASIPLDFYLDGQGPPTVQHNFATIYAPNVLDYAASLTTPPAGWYSISVNANDHLVISTSTPFGDPQFPYEPHNYLDPALELYNPQGTLVASDHNSGPDGKNALINYTAAVSGTYKVHILADTQAGGEYVLSVQGATGPLPPFAVTTTNPPGGSHLRSLPSITVDFNDTILLTSLSASSLTVDGTPATGFTIKNAHEVTWTLPALPGGDEVPHTIAIAAGGLSDIQGTAVSAFSETIYIDTVPPHVVGTSIEEGNVLPSGNLTYVVTFSEQMLISVTTASSFDLHGNFRNVDYAPSSFSWDATGTILTINYANLPDDAYKLTLFSSGFEDLVAFNLDGDPHTPRPPSVPSGDGDADGDFFIDFALDNDTPTAYPTPLTPKTPPGSLIYDPTVTNVLVPAGDTDQFTLNVNAGQTITAIVQSATLQGTIALADPNGNTIGTATSPAAGKDAVLQTVATTVGGSYTLTVGGAAGTTGLFTAQFILNAAAQNELHGGPSDDTIATAQDLTNAFLSLGTTGASRAAVLGKVPGGLVSGDVAISERASFFSPGGQIAIFDNSGNLLSTITNATMQAGFVQDARLGPDNTIYVGLDTAPGTGQGGELLHFDLNGNLLGTIHLPNDSFGSFFYPFGFVVASDGTFWVPQPNSGNIAHVDASGNLIRRYFVGGDPEDAAVRNDGQVFIANPYFVVQQLDPVSGSVTVFTSQTFYPLGLTFASPGGNGNLLVSDLFNGIEYFNNTGNQVNFVPAFLAGKSEADPSSNVFVPSFGFQDLRKFTYSGALLFDKGVSGPPIGAAVIGTDAPPPPPPDTSDYYSFILAAGQSVTITLSDVSNGQANIDLENSAGTILATGQAVGTKVNQAIVNFAAPAAGTYYVHVTGNGVQYNLVVTRGATFSLGNNHTAATSQDATNTNGGLGAIVPAPGVAIGTNFNGLSYNDTSCGCFPPDGALAVGNGYVMEGVNTALRITDTAGTNLLTEEFSTFFSGVGGTSFLSDPYIVYDDIAQRWYVTILDISFSFTYSDLLFAVSNDANPLHGFNLQERIHIGNSDFLDFEKMGFNHDAVVITANDFFFGFYYQSLQVVAIDKNALLSGTFTDYISQRDTSHFRAEVPAWMHGAAAGAPMYLVEEAGYGNGTAARVVTMTNILSNNPTFTDTNIPVNPYGFPAPADQPGSPFSVATNDTTFTRADWRTINGTSYLVSDQNASEPGGDAASHVHWYEFSTSGTPSLVQQGIIDPGSGISTYFGTVAINTNGDLGLTYMESSSSEFVSVYVTGRQAGDPLGTMRQATVVAAGTTGANPYYRFFRAGDYSGIAVDPDGTTFWAENEYAGNAFWNTYVTSFSVSPPGVEDWYKVTLPQYYVLRLTTSTPGDGPGQPHNTLNPHIDVFDSSGNLLASGTKLADGRNEALGFTAPVAGTYFIRIRGQNGTIGEYFLNLDNAGLVLLDPTASASLNGVGTTGTVRTIELGGGAIVIDSSSPTAAVLTGNAFATAGEFDITGVPGTSTSGNASFTGVIHSGMPAMADPLASLPVPAPPSPSYSAIFYSGSAPLTLNPGTYVGGIHISGSGAVTLLPGIYYMQGGGFSVSGTGSVTGTGVMIYNAPTKNKNVISVGQGQLNLTAPSSGIYQGIAIFQDRTSTASISVSGSAAVNVTGIVYAANAMVNISGNGVLNIYGPNSRLVSKDLMLSGNGTFDPEPRIPEFSPASGILPSEPASAAVAGVSDPAHNAAPQNRVVALYPDVSVFAAARLSSTAMDALIGRTSQRSETATENPRIEDRGSRMENGGSTYGNSDLRSSILYLRSSTLLPPRDSTAAESPIDSPNEIQFPVPIHEEDTGTLPPLWQEESWSSSRSELWIDRSDGVCEPAEVAAPAFDLSGMGAAIAALVGGFLPIHSPEGEPSSVTKRRNGDRPHRR